MLNWYWAAIVIVKWYIFLIIWDFFNWTDSWWKFEISVSAIILIYHKKKLAKYTNYDQRDGYLQCYYANDPSDNVFYVLKSKSSWFHSIGKYANIAQKKKMVEHWVSPLCLNQWHISTMRSFIGFARPGLQIINKHCWWCYLNHIFDLFYYLLSTIVFRQYD